MTKLLKILGIAAGAVVTLILLSVAGLYAWSNKELKATVPLPDYVFTPSASAAEQVARGDHLAKALAKCVDCHAPDLGGMTIVDDPMIGRIAGPNLTPGRGGVLAALTDADLERAIRSGLAKDGRRLVVMPAQDYQYLSDDDVAALIAYLRTLQPVDRESVPISIGPLARALYAAGKMPLFSANRVTGAGRPIASVPVDSNVAYGKYLGDIGCAGCHGATYAGGPIEGAPPGWPMAANLTPTGISHYTYADFARAMRDGVRPDGSKLNELMPTPATKLMTDVEIAALWKYLQTLPPKEFGVH